MSGKQIAWLCISLLLMSIETFAPGAFMLWLGFAAGGVFLTLFVVPGLSLLWQVVLFGVLSMVSVMIYVKYFRDKEKASDQPLLNRRGEQLMNQVYPLETAIVDGKGRLKIGDAFWQVQGDDLPAGTRVRIIAVDSMTLRVTSAE
jgi:inner membrane protein